MTDEITITREDLSQYKFLKTKLRKIAKDIEKTKKCMEESQKEKVIDKVYGGYGGKQGFIIEGFPTPLYDRLISTLIARISIWENLRVEVEEKRTKIETFLADLFSRNPAISQIISFRFIEDMTWEQVADNIGGKATSDSVKKAYERFMKNEKTA